MRGYQVICYIYQFMVNYTSLWFKEQVIAYIFHRIFACIYQPKYKTML